MLAGILRLILAVLQALPLFDKWGGALADAKRASDAAADRAAKDKRNADAIEFANRRTPPAP